MSVRVGAELAYKVNMGDYETYEVRYSIHDDAKEGENALQAHQRVEGLVSDLLWDEVEEARKLSTADKYKRLKRAEGGD